MDSQLVKTAIGLFGVGIFLTGCRDHSEGAGAKSPPWGQDLDGLVTANGGEELRLSPDGYVELLRRGDAWKSYEGGAFMTSSREEGELAGSLVDARDRFNRAGLRSRLLVSAPGELSFREISRALRSAARAGFDRIDFLVDDGTGRPGGLHLDLPVAVSCGVSWGIEPVRVWIDGSGSSWVGSGAGRERLDAGGEGKGLPVLEQSLSAYAAAAASCCVEAPPVQLAVDSHADYQRMIDVLASVKRAGIGRVRLVDVTDLTVTTCGGMRGPELRLESVAKPVPPRRTAGMPLAPPRENRPPRLVDPDLD